MGFRLFYCKLKLSPFLLPFSNLHSSSRFSRSDTSSISSPDNAILAKEERLLSLFKRCSSMSDLKHVHACLLKTGFEQNLFVVGKIVVSCASLEIGDMNYAVSVFDRIENPDGFLWNSMIRGFGRTNEPEKAFEFCRRMQEKRMAADNFTFSFLIKISGKFAFFMLGMQLHCSVLKHGFEFHEFVRNTLIHMYGLFDLIKPARYLFDEMPKPNVVAWNTIIDCYVHCKMFKEALNLFSFMLLRRVNPDDATLVVIFSACSSLGDLDFGRWVHSLIKNSYLQNIVSVSNAIIDMYAKCGAVEEAFEVFRKTGEKNIISWNTMIMGLATHGHADVALELFSKMVREKLEKPNDVSFLGVLCACSHGGKVEEGRFYFETMSKVYNVQPTLKHYGCMVDILGRAGFVEEAYDLIKGMPMESNSIIWRILLATCRMHGNINLGEIARSHLLEVEPDHSSDFVLLANMYASGGEWDDMLRVRKSMNKKRVMKPEPGNSYIQLDQP